MEQIVEKSIEFNKLAFLGFIDDKKVFDIVKTKNIVENLKKKC